MADIRLHSCAAGGVALRRCSVETLDHLPVVTFEDVYQSIIEKSKRSERMLLKTPRLSRVVMDPDSTDVRTPLSRAQALRKLECMYEALNRQIVLVVDGLIVCGALCVLIFCGLTFTACNLDEAGAQPLRKRGPTTTHSKSKNEKIMASAQAKAGVHLRNGHRLRM